MKVKPVIIWLFLIGILITLITQNTRKSNELTAKTHLTETNSNIKTNLVVN